MAPIAALPNIVASLVPLALPDVARPSAVAPSAVAPSAVAPPHAAREVPSQTKLEDAAYHG